MNYLLNDKPCLEARSLPAMSATNLMAGSVETAHNAGHAHRSGQMPAHRSGHARCANGSTFAPSDSVTIASTRRAQWSNALRFSASYLCRL